MSVVVNKGLRKIIFNDGQVRKELAPHQEKKISHEAADLLVKSFPSEVFKVKIETEEITPPVKVKKK